jgi:glycerol uptake facilitator-like aquaporin
MPPEGIARRLAAEFLGSLLLATAVIGSGIMAERLSSGNTAVALIANTGATVAALLLLITILGPISGAHFNPAVTLVMSLRGAVDRIEAVYYAIVQCLGCCAGAVLAHAMFALPLLQSGSQPRAGTGQWLGEIVASFGLLFVILGARRAAEVPWLVAAWIGGAYWFTSSTSFANPAITIGRSLSDTFAGIRPADAPAFIAAQFAGALLALLIARALFRAETPRG